MMKVTLSNDAARILAFLQANDNCFVPPLSSKVNLETYAKKLAANAVNLFLLGDTLDDIGHAAVYVNSGATSFLSSFCLQPGAHGTGASVYLLKEVYRCCLNENSVLLELEVDALNSKAVRFYQKHGFRLFNKLSNSQLMRKSIETIS